MRIVNIHSHVIADGILGAAGPYGPEFESTSEGFRLRVGGYSVLLKTRTQQAELDRGGRLDPSAWFARLADPGVRLREMDEKGIDIMGVTTSPLFYLYGAESEIGVPFARATNDALARYCDADRSRLFFMATLPLQDLEASRREIVRAVESLGARAINVGGSSFAGRELDDEQLYPLYAEMEKPRVPLCIHPSYEALSRPQEPAEHRRYDLQSILEYPYQGSIAFATLVFGGVFDTFPNLQVYITHGGGMIPYQFGRLEAWVSINGARGKRPLREYLRNNFFFDIHVHDPLARRFLVEWMGTDNLVIGDNYQGLDSTDGLQLLRELHLPSDAEAKIAGENAVRLLRLDA